MGRLRLGEEPEPLDSRRDLRPLHRVVSTRRSTLVARRIETLECGHQLSLPARKQAAAFRRCSACPHRPGS